MEQACKASIESRNAAKFGWTNSKSCVRRTRFSSPPPPLAFLSMEDIQMFVIGRMKLLHRFNDGNKNLDFVTESATKIPRICDLTFLLGGRFLLTVTMKKGTP